MCVTSSLYNTSDVNKNYNYEYNINTLYNNCVCIREHMVDYVIT